MLPIGTRVVVTTDEYDRQFPKLRGSMGTVYSHSNSRAFDYLIKMDGPVTMSQGGLNSRNGFYAKDEWLTPIQNNLKREDFL